MNFHRYDFTAFVDLDGNKVYPGSRVNVKWMGVWYDGKIIKIGPQKNLCKVHTYLTIVEILVRDFPP